MAYSETKLKSNGGKTSPYFKPGARLDVSDKRKTLFPSSLGIRNPHHLARSPSGEETQMEDFTSCMWCHRAVVVRGCVAAGTVHAQVMSTIRVMSTVTCSDTPWAAGTDIIET